MLTFYRHYLIPFSMLLWREYSYIEKTEAKRLNDLLKDN